MRGHLLADLTWPEVRPILDAGSAAVLPVGAAAKEHGPQLMMDTDHRTGEALGRLLAERAHVLVWPTVGYGFYPAFVDYPGSTSIDADTFEATIRQLIGDLRRAGARRVLVLNTGISTIRPIERAAEGRADVANVYRGERYLAKVAEVCEQERGGHADEAETSIALHLFGDRVRMDRAEPWTREVKPGRWSATDPSSPSYSPPGVFGDPTKATAEKGRALVEAMLDDLVQLLS